MYTARRRDEKNASCISTIAIDEKERPAINEGRNFPRRMDSSENSSMSGRNATPVPFGWPAMS